MHVDFQCNLVIFKPWFLLLWSFFAPFFFFFLEVIRLVCFPLFGKSTLGKSTVEKSTAQFLPRLIWDDVGCPDWYEMMSVACWSQPYAQIWKWIFPLPARSANRHALSISQTGSSWKQLSSLLHNANALFSVFWHTFHSVLSVDTLGMVGYVKSAKAQEQLTQFQSLGAIDCDSRALLRKQPSGGQLS